MPDLWTKFVMMALQLAMHALTWSAIVRREPLQGAALHNWSWSCRWAFFKGEPRAGAEWQPNGP